ncbi:MAG: hypothetical protein EP344_04830 [Bacteroidetes bacterium]|nr:MAG: hypothetical protein EP344_04830 [Bacteroidota bacterium]
MKLSELQAKLKERVAKGLNFGMEAVEEVVDPNSAVYNEYILLKSKYNDLMYVSSLNTLPYEQIEIGLNRLRSSLIGIIDKLEVAGLQKEEVASDLKIRALPTRRENFFKLLDIHFKNLEAICYVEIFGEEENRYSGRQGVFQFYQLHRRKFRNEEGLDTIAGLDKVREYFQDYFRHENGIFEVYFKNIGHLLSYTLESDIEQQFFLDTLRSLFSRYELGLLFYYSLSGIDPAFTDMVRKTQLIDPSVKSILISPGHYPKLA